MSAAACGDADFCVKNEKIFRSSDFGTLVAYLIMYKTAFIGPWCDLLLSGDQQRR